MTAFTLVVQPDGHAILTTTVAMSQTMTAAIHQAFREWREDPGATLVIPDCDVVQVLDVEIDIPEPVAV